MDNTGTATHEHDKDRMLVILANAPVGGLSLDEIQKATEVGEKWSLRTINTVLCDLGTRVSFTKIRVRHNKVTKYQIRSN
jgi:hypothetical protein